MSVILCPDCGTRVDLMAGGRCPACLAAVGSRSESAGEVASTPERRPSPSPTQEAIQRLHSAEQARRHYTIASVFFAVGFLILGGGLVWVLRVHPPEDQGLKVKPRDGRVVIVLLAGPFFALGNRQWYKARQLSARSAGEILAQDHRAPVLYLRSFQDDGSGLRMPGYLALNRIEVRSSTHEETLARTLREVGPVVAIGRPGEPLPELGAHRMYVTDDRWQDEVKGLMERACLVVLRLGTSAGLKWEFETMVASVAPQRILLYLEPAGQVPEAFWRLLPCGQAPAPKGRYLTFDADWKPHAGRVLWFVLYRAGLVHFTAKRICLLVLVLLAGSATLALVLWLLRLMFWS